MGNRSLHVGPSEKVPYLTLDLLKSFLLCTIRKKITLNEILNVRLQEVSWTYWKSSLKQEKDPYKWCTIEYKSINTGASENIFCIQTWSTSKDRKTDYAIKTEPTEKFL